VKRFLQKLLPETFAFTMRQALRLASDEEKVSIQGEGGGGLTRRRSEHLV